MKNSIIENTAMCRSIGLAQLALGKTYPNPMVGSVVMFENQCIGEGFHPKAGQPHAEVFAIRSAVQNVLPQSHIFVTLEPCAHFGKTPPCAVLIMDKKIPEVTIGTRDIHQKVNGKGIKMLEEKGITVHESHFNESCQELNKRFFTYHEKKRPYIILKWAQSADGFIDKNGNPFAISNGLVKQFVHTLRSHEHAIMVGKNTALNDNPSLTTRAVSGRNPTRIILDRKLEIPSHYAIMNDEAETMIINEVKDEIRGNIRFVQVQNIKNLQEVFEQLYSLEIQSVLIEGGNQLLTACIAQGFWDEAIVIKNHHLNLEKGTYAPKIEGTPVAKKAFRDNEVLFYQH